MSGVSSEKCLISKIVAYLTKILDHLSSFEDRRKAFLTAATSGFSFPADVQMYAYGANKSPVSLPIHPERRYGARDIRGVLVREAEKGQVNEAKTPEDGNATQRRTGRDAGYPKHIGT